MAHFRGPLCDNEQKKRDLNRGFDHEGIDTRMQKWFELESLLILRTFLPL